jgi:hypothetical protein
MAENNLDKALAYLGTSLNSLVTQANGPVDLTNLHTRILKRSLTGDHLMGGTIVNFASTGIKDEATTQQLTIKDSGIEVKSLTVGSVKGDLAVENSLACINIPMAGIIESLNLGTTTGIVLYEIAKQRREFKLGKIEKRNEKFKNKK